MRKNSKENYEKVTGNYTICWKSTCSNGFDLLLHCISADYPVKILWHFSSNTLQQFKFSHFWSKIYVPDLFKLIPNWNYIMEKKIKEDNVLPYAAERWQLMDEMWDDNREEYAGLG